MRGRLVFCFFLIATTACTRDNPAFEGGSTGTGETNGDGDPTTLTTLDEAEGSSSSQEGPDESCDLQGGIPLEIDLGVNSCADSPEAYDRFHPLVSIDGSTLLVGTCDPNALDCFVGCETDTPIALSFAPLDLTNMAPPGSCLHIHARRINPTDPSGCRYQSVVIESDSMGVQRRVVMAGRNSPGILLPFDNASPLANFNPVLTYIDSCSCSEFPEQCCGDLAPTVYGLDIGDTDPDPVPIGGHAEVTTTDSTTYIFKTLDAFLSGECNQGTQEAWGLVLK